MTNKKAFTLIEILIAIALCTMIATASIVFMTRGSSNVARGSFNTMAANQSALICYYLRSDILSYPYMDPSDINVQEGANRFAFTNIKGEKVTYEQVGVSGSSERTNLIRTNPNGKVIKLGSDFISYWHGDVNPGETKIIDGKSCRKINYGRFTIQMKEKDNSTYIASWTTTIYAPKASSSDEKLNKYWNSSTGSSEQTPAP